MGHVIALGVMINDFIAVGLGLTVGEGYPSSSPPGLSLSNTLHSFPSPSHFTLYYSTLPPLPLLFHPLSHYIATSPLLFYPLSHDTPCLCLSSFTSASQRSLSIALHSLPLPLLFDTLLHYTPYLTLSFFSLYYTTLLTSPSHF